MHNGDPRHKSKLNMFYMYSYNKYFSFDICGQFCAHSNSIP